MKKEDFYIKEHPKVLYQVILRSYNIKDHINLIYTWVLDFIPSKSKFGFSSQHKNHFQNSQKYIINYNSRTKSCSL